MSTLFLFLHIGFALFTLGPVTAATHATPRAIRNHDVGVLRFLNRTTRIYALLSLGVFFFGLLVSDDRFDEMWLSASMTLFIVSFGLLLIVDRDQRKAVQLLEVAAAGAAQPGGTADAATTDAGEAQTGADVASVERGRIAAISGVITLLWLIILVLMVWNN